MLEFVLKHLYLKRIKNGNFRVFYIKVGIAHDLKMNFVNILFKKIEINLKRNDIHNFIS